MTNAHETMCHQDRHVSIIQKVSCPSHQPAHGGEGCLVFTATDQLPTLALLPADLSSHTWVSLASFTRQGVCETRRAARPRCWAWCLGSACWASASCPFSGAGEHAPPRAQAGRRRPAKPLNPGACGGSNVLAPVPWPWLCGLQAHRRLILAPETSRFAGGLRLSPWGLRVPLSPQLRTQEQLNFRSCLERASLLLLLRPCPQHVGVPGSGIEHVPQLW